MGSFLSILDLCHLEKIAPFFYEELSPLLEIFTFGKLKDRCKQLPSASWSSRSEDFANISWFWCRNVIIMGDKTGN